MAHPLFASVSADDVDGAPAAPVRCAVIGQPIAHSLSPRLHAAFARQFALALDYGRIDAAPDAFADRVRAFFAAGGRGLNVTLPHKAAAYALADRHQPRARLAGAANTLWMEGGKLVADNTDGTGLVRDLQRLGVALAGARVLVLGAGGATAGILLPLLEAGVAGIDLLNRTPARAAELVAAVADPRVAVYAPAALADHRLLISAVADGAPALLDMAFAGGAGPGPETVAYDLNYGARAAAFLDACAARGLRRRHDGFGMLIEQAAESFRLWHGLSPDTAPVHAGDY